MSIVCFPDEMRPIKTVICALCGQKIALVKATAGLFDADGNQAFACNDHFFRGYEFILGWTDFSAVERMRLLIRGEEPNYMSDLGGGNDWPLP